MNRIISIILVNIFITSIIFGRVDTKIEYKLKNGIRHFRMYSDNRVLLQKFDYFSENSTIRSKVIGDFYNVTNRKFLGNWIESIKDGDKENFDKIKDLFMEKQFSSTIFSGISSDKGILMELYIYLDSLTTQKIIQTKIDSSKYQFKSFINERLVEEGIMSSYFFLSEDQKIAHSNSEIAHLNSDFSFASGIASPIFFSKTQIIHTSNYILESKVYNKNNQLLYEIFNDEEMHKFIIYYDQNGVEIGKCGLNTDDCNFRSYCHNNYGHDPNFDHYKNYDLILINGQYEDGVATREWYHYGYSVINDDEIELNKQILDPKSQKIIYKGNLSQHEKKGDWIFSYILNENKKLNWNKGVNTQKALTNTNALRILKSNFHLKQLSTGNSLRNSNSHWSPSLSEGVEIGYQKYKVIISGEFKNNLQHGVWEAYRFPGDILLERTNYIDGKIDGTLEFFYLSGEIFFKGNYSLGKRTGEWNYYFKNGNMMAKGEIENEKPIGKWFVYNEDGILLSDQEKWRFFK